MAGRTDVVKRGSNPLQNFKKKSKYAKNSKLVCFKLKILICQQTLTMKMSKFLPMNLLKKSKSIWLSKNALHIFIKINEIFYLLFCSRCRDVCGTKAAGNSARWNRPINLSGLPLSLTSSRRLNSLVGGFSSLPVILGSCNFKIKILGNSLHTQTSAGLIALRPN